MSSRGKCPMCQGRGYNQQLKRVSFTYWWERGVQNPCHVCKGTGKSSHVDRKGKRKKWATDRQYQVKPQKGGDRR